MERKKFFRHYKQEKFYKYPVEKKIYYFKNSCIRYMRMLGYRINSFDQLIDRLYVFGDDPLNEMENEIDSILTPFDAELYLFILQELEKFPEKEKKKFLI